MMLYPRLSSISWTLLAVFPVFMACADAQKIGYDDTPIIPGTEWHVHDGDRPQPPVVTPGETFSHEAPPPLDATVLFDGKDLSAWEKSGGGEPGWTVRDGYLEVKGRTGNIRTTERFEDFQIHLEFASPEEVRGSGQGRGNSGLFFNGVYEVQILDSYENPTYADGQAGALYGQTPGLVNASTAPGEWQTYDVVFESPRWDESGKLVKRANVTVIHNGVVLHHKRELLGPTSHKSVKDYGPPHEPAVFIELQDHGDPVRFRNIWVRPLGE